MEGSDEPPREATAAEVVETGVPGLHVTRGEPGALWRLVHHASGLLLSRVVVYSEPQPLVRVARLIAPLTDWTATELAVAGPVLRKAIEEAAAKAGLPMRPGASGNGRPAGDRDLLLRVLRRVHTAVPPGVFASAIADLGPEERARLRALLTDEEGATGAVVRPLPPSLPGRTLPEEAGGTPRSGSAAV